MGTQQILMIVLSVIVVGTAVLVGIMMYENQARTQTKAAIASELIDFGINIQAYFRTPTLYGGAGNSLSNISDQLLAFINNGIIDNPISTQYGTHQFTFNTSDPYLDIEMNSIPSVNNWVALARIFYDGRTRSDQGIDKGIWVFVGPSPAPQPPDGQ